MASKHMKAASHQAINKVQIKRMRYHHILDRMAKIRNTDNTQCSRQFRATALFFHRVKVKLRPYRFASRAGNAEHATGLEEAFLYLQF